MGAGGWPTFCLHRFGGAAAALHARSSRGGSLARGERRQLREARSGQF